MSEQKHTVIPVADTAAPHAIMHPLVAKMLEKDPTPEALEKILKMQADWEKSEAKRAYDAALVELKRALPPFLARDKVVDYQSAKGRTHYTHTSLASAMDTVTPILSNHGFSMTWKPGSDDKGQVVVTAKLTHRLGHFEDSTLKAAPDATGNKNGPQAVASTVTLLARYACLGLLGLATADMEEPTQQVVGGSERVDTARNMRAIGDIVKAGKTKAEAEKVVGKPIAEWTLTDLDKVRAWLDHKADAKQPIKITKAEAKALKGLMETLKLKPEQLAAIIEDEIGRPLEGGAMDLSLDEYQQITKTLDLVAGGEYSIVDGKVVRPPE